MMYKGLITAFCAFFFLAACVKETVPEQNSAVKAYPGEGVFIVNEGNFTAGNAGVGFYNTSKDVYADDLFKPANGRALGDVFQSMLLFNKQAYLVVNNSGKIEVVDTATFKVTATIQGLKSPRYLLPVSNSKAYVSDLFSNAISVVNLTTNVKIKEIPCKGWTEAMALHEGKVFVSNMYRHCVYLVDTTFDQVVDSIRLNYGSNSICKDKNNKLWILCGGNKDKGYKGGLFRVNPVTKAVELSLDFPVGENPTKLCINATGDKLYYLNKEIYSMAITENVLPVNILIDRSGRNIYGLAIDPYTSTLYLADAIDYVQRSRVYHYQLDGTLINTFTTGIITGNFCFKP